ncbi:MAG: hypothetical protein WCA46_01220 [Actinocatenispora sp.]
MAAFGMIRRRHQDARRRREGFDHVKRRTSPPSPFTQMSRTHAIPGPKARRRTTSGQVTSTPKTRMPKTRARTSLGARTPGRTTSGRTTSGRTTRAATTLTALCLLLAPVLAGCGEAGADGAVSDRPAATTVATLRPWASGGDLAHGLRATGGPERGGSCWTSSEVTGRADAFRCAIGNTILDPCLSDPHAGTPARVACPVSPTRMRVVLLTEALPAPTGTARKAGDWLFLLLGGDQCVRRTGAGPAPRGDLPLTMTCRSGALIWGEPDTGRRVWTVRSSKTEHGALSVRQVAAAYR